MKRRWVVAPDLNGIEARDLLQPEGVSKASLEVREHPKARRLLMTLKIMI